MACGCGGGKMIKEKGMLKSVSFVVLVHNFGKLECGPTGKFHYGNLDYELYNIVPKFIHATGHNNLTVAYFEATVGRSSGPTRPSGVITVPIGNNGDPLREVEIVLTDDDLLP